MNEVTFWLPVSSLVILAFSLALKLAEKSHRIRLLEKEVAERTNREAQLQRTIDELQKERPKRRVWPDDYKRKETDSEQNA